MYSQFISIIVPCYNEAEHIEKCLNSLLNQSYPRDLFEIIVVDNGSTDDTLKIAKSFPVSCMLLRHGNVGAVRNLGVKESIGEIVSFIDGDCVASEDWLANIAQSVGNRRDIAVGGGANLPESANWLEKYWLLDNSSGSYLPKHLVGCSMALNKETFEAANGFDESVTSGEDTKLTTYLANKNIEIWIDKSLSVVHLGNAKTANQFIRRQAWHSENYLNDVYFSSRDPIFYITILFAIFNLTAIVSLFFSLSVSGVLFFISLLLTSLLTLKRIYRARYFSKLWFRLPVIYFVDYLYLVGRTLGLSKSIFNKLTA